MQSAIDQLTQDVKEKLSLELKESGKITIDVPGVGDGKVELTSGIVVYSLVLQILALTFPKTLSRLSSRRARSTRESIFLT